MRPWRIIPIVSLAVLLLALSATAALAMPANEAAIVRGLKARGAISAHATAAQTKAAYTAYLERKLGDKPDDRGNVLAERALGAAEKAGRPMTFRHGQSRPNNARFDTILTVLVEFAGDDAGSVGPLHNAIQAPAPGVPDYWLADFSPSHYQSMLFDLRSSAKSMSNYYLEQSGGAYSVDGKVTPWVKLPHSEAWYGADGADTDDANGPAWRIVVDAVQALGSTVDWAKYDKEDIYDLDGDGNYGEPDGYVDHIQLIHAGAGQEAGGGAQGDDSIWSHSWWVGYQPAPYQQMGVQTSNPNVFVGPYTIEPEDGTVGVFCHEFAHDLGLPDQYDTIYSGESSTGFWTLMSSGSWLSDAGKPLGTSPSDMNAWEKYALGWLDPSIVAYGQRAKKVTLKETTARGPSGKGLRVNLPGFSYDRFITDAFDGAFWYSGSGDNLNNTLTLEAPATLASDAALDFVTWYDIEAGYDYGFVDVSTDGGATWAPIPGNLTVEVVGANPPLYGLSGVSGTWVSAHYDLSAFAGATTKIRLRYFTDGGVAPKGWAVDNLALTSGGATIFSSNADDAAGLVADGWTTSMGTDTVTALQYYIAEWRTPTGFDTSMNNWYNYLPDGTPEYLKATPGMLLWYRNTRWSDNWTGLHPFNGQLLAVDAHPELIVAQGSEALAKSLWGDSFVGDLPFRTRIQLVDATFSPAKTVPTAVSSWWQVDTFPTAIPARPGVAMFDDSIEYVDRTFEPWFSWDPGLDYFLLASGASVDTPTYGLKIKVDAMKPGSATVIAGFSGVTP